MTIILTTFHNHRKSVAQNLIRSPFVDITLNQTQIKTNHKYTLHQKLII